MPYEVRKVKGGFKAAHKGTDKTYSKKPQSRQQAAAQIRAIAASEFGHGSGGHK
jgi:hypothetical protein